MTEQQETQTREAAQENSSRLFNPNEHLIQIKNRGTSADYLPCQWRLVWFRSLFPHGTIETEIVHLDLERETEEEMMQWNNETRRSEKVVKRAPGFAVFRATVKDGEGGVATGTKSEKAASFGDFLEKAETGAIGRALAALGYGTQFAANEFDEGHRLADSPTDRSGGNNKESNGRAAPVEVDPNSPMTQDQLRGIMNIAKRLGKEVATEGLTHQQAKELIAKLNQDYLQARKA